MADVQRTIMESVLEWWGPPNVWTDRQISLLTSSGDPLLAYLPPSKLESLDGEQADRVVQVLGQTSDVGKVSLP